MGWEGKRKSVTKVSGHPACWCGAFLFEWLVAIIFVLQYSTERQYFVRCAVTRRAAFIMECMRAKDARSVKNPIDRVCVRSGEEDPAEISTPPTYRNRGNAVSVAAEVTHRWYKPLTVTEGRGGKRGQLGTQWVG